MNSKNVFLPLLVLGVMGSLVGIWYLNSAGPNLHKTAEGLQKSKMLSTAGEEAEPIIPDLEQEQIPVVPQDLKAPEIPDAAKTSKTLQSSPVGSQIQNNLKNIQKLPPQESEEVLQRLRESRIRKTLRNVDPQ